jgi:alkanesulfonate monooxygenase SsuD/methylene tetrahydromethanopterin reductase-like flavin-dependent oxidoreductase (luciferase family)
VSTIEFQYFTSFRVTQTGGGSWPLPGAGYDAGEARDLIDQALADILRAEELGFHRITIPEHHYGGGVPNPILVAAYVAPHLTRATLGVLGSIVPLHNPLRLAEDLAALDNFVGGTLKIGLLSGVPYEYLTYGTPPGEAKERYTEGVELILRAWDEPYPFSWEGRHHRHRVVSVWPRPVGEHRSRVLVSGSSPASIDFAARHRLGIGISHLPVDRAAAAADRYRRAAEKAGWLPGADDITYHTEVYVDETDAAADAAIERFGLGTPPAGAIRPEAAAEIARALNPLGAPRESLGNLVKFRGSPATVADQLHAAQERIGFGALDCIFPRHRLPRELAAATVELFGREVIPQFAPLRAAS